MAHSQSNGENPYPPKVRLVLFIKASPLGGQGPLYLNVNPFFIHPVTNGPHKKDNGERKGQRT
jgi:hypothetical protein